MGLSVASVTVKQRFGGSARFGNHCSDFLLFNSDPHKSFTCSFVFHEDVEGNPASGPSVSRGALVLRQGSAAEGVEHHCPLVCWARDQHVIDGPVVLVQAVVFRLPPAKTGPNGLGIVGEENVHKAEKIAEISCRKATRVGHFSVLWVLWPGPLLLFARVCGSWERRKRVGDEACVPLWETAETKNFPITPDVSPKTGSECGGKGQQPDCGMVWATSCAPTVLRGTNASLLD